MKHFMKGRELARNFYQEIVRKLINVPHGAALVGEGSEVLGYDQPSSTDYNWGSRVTIFVQEFEVEIVKVKYQRKFPENIRGIR